MNADEAFVRAALYESFATSNILRHINCDNMSTTTLRNLINREHMLGLRKLPIVITKLLTKITCEVLVKKCPALGRYVVPSNLSIDIEDDELALLLESSSKMRPNIVILVAKNILIGVLGTSISQFKQVLLNHPQVSKHKTTDDVEPVSPESSASSTTNTPTSKIVVAQSTTNNDSTTSQPLVDDNISVSLETRDQNKIDVLTTGVPLQLASDQMPPKEFTDIFSTPTSTPVPSQTASPNSLRRSPSVQSTPSDTDTHNKMMLTEPPNTLNISKPQKITILKEEKLEPINVSMLQEMVTSKLCSPQPSTAVIVQHVETVQSNKNIGDDNKVGNTTLTTNQIELNTNRQIVNAEKQPNIQITNNTHKNMLPSAMMMTTITTTKPKNSLSFGHEQTKQQTHSHNTLLSATKRMLASMTNDDTNGDLNDVEMMTDNDYNNKTITNGGKVPTKRSSTTNTLPQKIINGKISKLARLELEGDMDFEYSSNDDNEDIDDFDVLTKQTIANKIEAVKRAKTTDGGIQVKEIQTTKLKKTTPQFEDILNHLDSSVMKNLPNKLDPKNKITNDGYTVTSNVNGVNVIAINDDNDDIVSIVLDDDDDENGDDDNNNENDNYNNNNNNDDDEYYEEEEDDDEDDENHN